MLFVGCNRHEKQFIIFILIFIYLIFTNTKTKIIDALNVAVRPQIETGGEEKTNFTHHRMLLFHNPQCFIQNRNVHMSVLNGALWDMEQVHSGIYE